MERTIRRFFPFLAPEEIKLSSLISPKEEMHLYKARVVYGAAVFGFRHVRKILSGKAYRPGIYPCKNQKTARAVHDRAFCVSVDPGIF